MCKSNLLKPMFNYTTFRGSASTDEHFVSMSANSVFSRCARSLSQPLSVLLWSHKTTHLPLATQANTS